jgi:hypothetical protein
MYIIYIQGTVPFMAIGLLSSEGPIIHQPRHDLESLFFVLIYLCTNIQCPGLLRNVDELDQFKSLPMSSWFDPKATFMRLALDKLGAMSAFDQRILPYFSSYFDELKPCIRSLYNAIFPSLDPIAIFTRSNDSSCSLHDTFIHIFDKTLETLSHVDTVNPPIMYKRSSSHSQQRKKRYVGFHHRKPNNKRKSVNVSASHRSLNSATPSGAVAGSSSLLRGRTSTIRSKKARVA